MLIQLVLLSVTLITLRQPFPEFDLDIPYLKQKNTSTKAQQIPQPSTKTQILGAATAVESNVTSPSATPSATPTVTPLATPTPTIKPTPTSTPRPTLTPTPRPTVTLSPTPSPTTPPVLPKYTATPKTPSPTTRPTVKNLTGPEMDALFSKYSSQYNIDREQLRRIAICESSLNPQAKNINYVGLYQFGQSAWVSARQSMGLSTDLTLRTDPEESIKTAAWMISQGRASAWPNCK